MQDDVRDICTLAITDTRVVIAASDIRTLHSQKILYLGVNVHAIVCVLGWGSERYSVRVGGQGQEDTFYYSLTVNLI